MQVNAIERKMFKAKRESGNENAATESFLTLDYTKYEDGDIRIELYTTVVNTNSADEDDIDSINHLTFSEAGTVYRFLGEVLGNGGTIGKTDGY